LVEEMTIEGGHPGAPRSGETGIHIVKIVVMGLGSRAFGARPG
jgi:hypothetical protein